MKASSHGGRSGVAAMWALLVIAIATAMTAATIARFASARRQIDADKDRTQCEWLARAGYETAVAKLLADPTGYAGETVNLIASGEVKIKVQQDPENKDVYHVSSEASYPLGGKRTHVQTLRRSFKRLSGPNGNRIQPLSTRPE